MTLFEMISKSYLRLGQMVVRQATGGSTSTVVDSGIANEGRDNDYKGAPVFIMEADAAAPEGEFSQCSASTNSSGTITVSPAFTIAPASGDRYALGTILIPLWTAIDLANDALRQIGDIPLIDSSTTTVAGQRQYSVPVVVKRRKPLRIEINISDTSSDTNRQMIPDWDWIPAAAGSTGLIQLHRQPVAGQTLYMWYRGIHPDVSLATATIAEVIEPELAIAACSASLAAWGNRRQQGQDDFWKTLEDKMQRDFDRIMQTRSIDYPDNEPRLFVAGDQENVRYSRFTGDELAV